MNVPWPPDDPCERLPVMISADAAAEAAGRPGGESNTLTLHAPLVLILTGK